jgi:hypothetical protein
MYEKTTSQFQIQFNTKDYLRMSKTLQLFTETFTFDRDKFHASKLLKDVCTDTKLLKMKSSLKLGLN